MSIAFVLLRSIKRNSHSQSTITQAWRERAKQRGFIERPAPSQPLQQAEASPIRWSSLALRYRNQRYPVWTDTRHGPGPARARPQRRGNGYVGCNPPPPLAGYSRFTPADWYAVSTGLVGRGCCYWQQGVAAGMVLRSVHGLARATLWLAVVQPSMGELIIISSLSQSKIIID